MPGPLSHLRILDLSRVLAGPWSTQFFADLGAEVIKVERPGLGDDTRGWGPPFVVDPDPEAGEAGMAAYFTCANRGKKSVAIDFTTPEGAAKVRELAATADVVVENFKRGGLVKYGLDYEALRAVKPDLVYCSITGFGQDGPYADRAGYDFMIQGMGGLMSITGQPDGEPGAEPLKVGVAVVDLFTGMYAASGVLAALSHRDRTGEGQHIDVALLDVQVAMLANQAANFLASGKAPGRLGNAHPNICPYQAFATADGHLILAVGNDQQFRRFCEVAGAPELGADERFATNRQRVANRVELVALLRPLLAARPRGWWIGTLEEAGVPCGPINSIADVFADPQVVARGLKVEGTLEDGTPVAMVANPLKFSATPLGPWGVPPTLGQHDTEILGE
ncbi:CaiB/BaiF CoA transferase family protein [Azospirillum thermophilum]|uniref:CoA transferase n=1 Tax=Azospirillum thermophilum TaxID=2202148 RepID=A0A2S2CV28_9PROT|nr:CaiB/BaiF CoA-transferase family protein [Azospirillum thermophilum]AWK88137.1 CoA transferase [Azospirillum thermophilum]